MPTYTVKTGDTKSKLAKQFGISINDSQFRSSDPNKLFAGETISYGGDNTTPSPVQNGAVNLANVQEGTKPFVEAVPEAPVAGQIPEIQPVSFETLTPKQQLQGSAQQIQQEIATLEEKMSKREQDRNAQYDEQGVYDDLRQLNALKDELRTAEDRDLEIPIEKRQELRGRQATKTEFNQATRPELEKNALRSLAASRNVSRLSDTIETNVAVIDQTIKAQQEADEFLYTQKKNRLETVQKVLGDIMTEEQKAAAAAQKFEYDLILEGVKSDNELRNDLLKNLATSGVGGAQLQGAMDMTVDELLSLQGERTDPKRWSEMSFEEAAMVLDKDSFNKFEAYRSWEKTATAEEKAQAEETAAVTLNAKGIIETIETMLDDDQGLKVSVGESGLGRTDISIPFTSIGKEGSNFRVNAKKLTAQKTLDQLLQIKKAGATLGAISEKELQILADAATALGAMYDKKGNATGKFDLDPATFEEALETMRIGSMKTYIAANIGADAFNRANYLNADFETIQKRYNDLIENGGTPQPNFAEDELSDPNNLNAAFETIRQEEGLRTEAYQDVTGKWTIGFGNTIINGRPVQPGDRLSTVQAEQLMQQSVVNNYTTFVDKVNTDISPSQFAALTSFEYNLGPGVWNTPTGNSILSLVDSGRYNEAGRLMLQYNKARDPQTGELVTNRVLAQRRAREASMLLT